MVGRTQLFIYLFLHQTTTSESSLSEFSLLFIYLFLHQTTTGASLSVVAYRCLSIFSYIKPQLMRSDYETVHSCLSIFSYIKPQLDIALWIWISVVYLSFPTSNHNIIDFIVTLVDVVYLSFPTSNHNLGVEPLRWLSLFIYLFLHQTTTRI